LDYFIEPDTSPLAQDWVAALKQDLITPKLMLEKNYCFIGFAKTSRTLEYLCEQLNHAVYQINTFNRARIWQNAGLADYQIEEWFSPDVVRYGTEYPVAEGGNQSYDVGLQIKHDVMNRLHYHFEQLQGTVWNLSGYYQLADYNTKYAIRQLNNICHEIESLVLSQRKAHAQPEWQRPSQITTWLTAPRHELTDQHRQGFLQNGYDRQFGHVYMHWTQIGKTLIEIFRDEGAPELTETVCSAINELRFYSGEFDIEWGKDVVYNSAYTPWHTDEQNRFKEWLIANNRDPADPKLSLGYLHLGQVDLLRSFGTQDPTTIWESMSQHLDIYKIEVDGVSATYDYCWTDVDYKEQQIAMMKPGYDYQARTQK
jgi:hypothetical protein